MSCYPSKSQSAYDALGLQFGTDKPHTRSRPSSSLSGMETSTSYTTLPLPISSIFDPEDSSQPEQASLPPLILIQAPTSPGPEQAKPQPLPWPAAGSGPVFAPLASLSPLQTLVPTPAPVRAPLPAPGLSPTKPAYSLRPAIFPPRASTPSCWPQAIPIPLHAKVDCHYFLRVASNGSRGVCLAHLDTAFNGAEPRVDLASIREQMDWADTCLCSHTMGPTVRMADVGREVCLFGVLSSVCVQAHFVVLWLWFWCGCLLGLKSLWATVDGFVQVRGAVPHTEDGRGLLHVRPARTVRRRPLFGVVGVRGRCS